MKSNEELNALSDYLNLAQCILQDASARCTATVFDLRDLMTIRARVETEGLSFLTITLPRFSRDFEQALENRVCGPALFRGFKRVKNGVIPEFLQGILAQIFDIKTGEMYNDDPQSNAGGIVPRFSTLVEIVRQLCRIFQKVRIDCAPKRVKSALDNYIKVEHDFETFSLQDEDMAKFLAISSMLWDNMVADFQISDILPKHGPGATAERISGNQKYVWRRWHQRLEPFFPIIGSGYSLGVVHDHSDEGKQIGMAEELEMVSLVPRNEEQPVRVVTVPKTLKSPRIIAIEPCCVQYTQQALQKWLYARIEEYSLTFGRINFRSQEVNQRLAMTSSANGRLATIDLSDASDRVPADLALAMFNGNPDLRDAIEACRSTTAHLPDGRHVGPLRKFASMGSALCFPIEAMYFYTLCVMALLEAKGLSLSIRNIKKVSKDIHVYGDDIIVPTDEAVSVLDTLKKYNCKVNVDKTFMNGKFRESCGVDAYDGILVSPIYLRREPPRSRRHVHELISWVATANLFEKKGYQHTAQFMLSKCERYLGKLPYVSETSSALGRISLFGYKRPTGRFGRKYHRFEINAWVPTPVYRSDPLDGYGALVKCLLVLEQRNPSSSSSFMKEEGFLPSYQEENKLRLAGFTSVDKAQVDKLHLKRSALHGAVALHRRWVPPS